MNIKYSLAENPNISEFIQLILVKDDSDVRCILSDNPSISRGVQLILSRDEDWRVRYSLIRNSSLLEEVKLILLEDGSDYFLL